MYHGRTSISAHTARKAYHAARHAHSALAKHLGGKGEAIVGQLSQSVEVGAAAFGFGLLNGRFGAVDIMGVPLDLGTGVFLQAVAFAGFAGKHGEHLHNFADGALGAYLTKLGAGVGAKMRTKAGQAPTSVSRSAFAKTTWAGDTMYGNMPGGGGASRFSGVNTGETGPLSVEELHAIQARTRAA